MGAFYKLPVKEITRITPNSVTMSFDIPNELKNTFSFTAGQYITIKKELGGKEIRRSYSICSSPKRNDLQIGIKKVRDGLFSRYANHDVKVGDVLEVHPPEGRFVFHADASKTRNVIAFACGSGITPIMSIAKTVLEDEPNSNFVLVYGNKSVTETMFYEEIASLLKMYPNRFTVHFMFSQVREDDALFGRIERSTVNFIIKNKYENTTFDAFYLCGPEMMINTVSKTLQENGIDKNSIYFELFTSSDDKKIEENLDGKAKVTVLLDDEERSFVMDKSKRILDAALREGLDAPYSCQGGVCSTCLAKLKEGKVKMVQNQILTDSELEEGFILTCQSHPQTNVIIVDYDDI